MRHEGPQESRHRRLRRGDKPGRASGSREVHWRRDAGESRKPVVSEINLAKQCNDILSEGWGIQEEIEWKDVNTLVKVRGNIPLYYACLERHQGDVLSVNRNWEIPPSEHLKISPLVQHVKVQTTKR